MRCRTVSQAVAARKTIAHSSAPQGASTRPAVMTTTRSAREPRPTSPRRPSASAFARAYGTRKEPATAATVKTTAVSFPRAGEDERDRGEHRTLADAVGGRVEEGAERRRLAAGPRQRAVEDVEDGADDEDARAEPVEEELVAVLERDEDGRGEAERDARRGERVRRDARAREAASPSGLRACARRSCSSSLTPAAGAVSNRNPAMAATIAGLR